MARPVYHGPPSMTWEKMGERLEIVIDWYTEYTLEQLYNIWMEAA